MCVSETRGAPSSSADETSGDDGDDRTTTSPAARADVRADVRAVVDECAVATAYVARTIPFSSQHRLRRQRFPDSGPTLAWAAVPGDWTSDSGAAPRSAVLSFVTTASRLRIRESAASGLK